jgi:hypothetical protein
MSGCGKDFNGKYAVEGAALRCGTHLYWKKVGGKDNARELEVHLCEECEEKETQ